MRRQGKLRKLMISHLSCEFDVTEHAKVRSLLWPLPMFYYVFRAAVVLTVYSIPYVMLQ